MEITLPPRLDGQTPENIDFNTLVVIGANGSGKTRFGSYIEENYKENVHRLSAQKSLSMPKFASTTSKKKAESDFRYGGWIDDNDTWHKTTGWKNQRWGGNLNTHLLDDYESLMILLHTNEYEALIENQKSGINNKTTLDEIIDIWQQVIPHRSLDKKSGIIEVKGNDINDYNSSEMSDGERVVFYLIAQVMSISKDSIIIIDEPEMHIHPSLVNNLFNLIESARPDCNFIYLTHNIDFAVTRLNARKIWMKSYNAGDVWDYEVLTPQDSIPEQLYLELLGSRKPILFLEGRVESIDYNLYQHVFSDYTIKPIDGCSKVIQTVKSFNEQSEFHNNYAYGLIDRDRRSESEVQSYNSKNIWVLDVAEIENLFLVEGIVKLISEYMGKESDEIFSEVKANLISYFGNQLENQIVIHFRERMKKRCRALYEFDAKVESQIITKIDEEFNSIDKAELFEDIRKDFKQFILNEDYQSILRVFNLKNALIPMSKLLLLIGVNNTDDYINLVISLIQKQNETAEELKNIVLENVLKGSRVS